MKGTILTVAFLTPFFAACPGCQLLYPDFSVSEDTGDGLEDPDVHDFVDATADPDVTIEPDVTIDPDVEIEPTGGTWTDTSSGLTWQNPPAESTMTWQNAMDYCESLTLDGGGWRLPTISELRSLIRGCPATQTGGSCGVDDECLSSSCWSSPCSGSTVGEGPDEGCYWPVEAEGPCSWYWSSSSREDFDDYAWYVGFSPGSVVYDYKVSGYYVRCVR